MVRLRSIILVFILTIVFLGVKAQDPHFSQYYANPLYLNPAFAGTKICPRMIMNYRNQWPAIPGAYVTYNASFDMHFKSLQGGLGLMAHSDRAGEGVLTTQSINLIYSVLIPVTKEFSIRAGFQAGYFQKHLDWNLLTFGDQIDQWGFTKETQEQGPRDNNGFYTMNSTDFSAGLLGYSKKFFIGFAAHHLVPVNESLTGEVSNLNMRLTAHGGGIIPLTDKRRKFRESDPQLSPNILFMMQGPYHQMNYGMYFKKQPMVFGLWYRHFFEGSDAIIALVGFEYDKFKFGYSYDITLSQVAVASGGAHEISFALDFNCPRKIKKVRAINCPSF